MVPQNQVAMLQQDIKDKTAELSRPSALTAHLGGDRLPIPWLAPPIHARCPDPPAGKRSKSAHPRQSKTAHLGSVRLPCVWQVVLSFTKRNCLSVHATPCQILLQTQHVQCRDETREVGMHTQVSVIVEGNMNVVSSAVDPFAAKKCEQCISSVFCCSHGF